MNTIGKDLRACLGLRSALEREIDEWRDAIVREIGRSDRELHGVYRRPPASAAAAPTDSFRSPPPSLVYHTRLAG